MSCCFSQLTLFTSTIAVFAGLVEIAEGQPSTKLKAESMELAMINAVISFKIDVL